MKILAIHLLLLMLLGVGLVTFPPYGTDPASVLYGCSLGLTLVCIWCLVSWRLMGGAALEPYTLFLAAAICFNAGHFLLYTFGMESPDSVTAKFDSETSLKTIMLIAIGLTSFHFGGLYAKWRAGESAPERPRTDGAIRPKAVAVIGIILLAVSFPAWMTVAYSRVGRVMDYGYFVASFGQEQATGLAHLPELLADALAPAMVFMVASSKNSLTIRRWALVVMAVFGVVTLFAGSKGPAVMAVLAFGWVWHRSIKPLRPSLLLIGGIVLALVVVPLTTAMREVAGRDRTSVSAVSSAYESIDNPIVAFLDETGWTGTTVAHTIELIPEVRPYDYGQSYGYAALAILPNLAGGLHPSKEHGFLADWLVASLSPEYASRGGGWGFSFIGEAYANFGWYGAPFALALIGYLLSRLFNWGQSSTDPAKIALVGACLCNCLLYARGESGPLIRELVWYALIPYVFVGLLIRKREAPARRSSAAAQPTPLAATWNS